MRNKNKTETIKQIKKGGDSDFYFLGGIRPIDLNSDNWTAVRCFLASSNERGFLERTLPWMERTLYPWPVWNKLYGIYYSILFNIIIDDTLDIISIQSDGKALYDLCTKNESHD